MSGLYEKATPRPWRIGSVPYLGTLKTITISAENRHIAELKTPHIGAVKQAWNAALIVHAVNNIEKLERDNARLREALEDVCAPVNYLRKYAERKGRELDGSAYVIANDLAFVQGIARSALNPHEGEKG